MTTYSKDSSFTPMKDEYLDNQTADGVGGSLSAYMTRWLQRTAHYLWDLLFNKDPDEWRDYNVYSGNGHDHDGINSSFIGKTAVCQSVQPFKDYELDYYLASPFTFYDSWNDFRLGYKDNLAYGNVSFDEVTGNLIPKILLGPGVTRARVFVSFVVANASGNLPSPAVTLKFRAHNGTTGDSVDKDIDSPGGLGWEHWQEITSAMKLICEPGVENDFDITVGADSDSGGSRHHKVALYGVMILEDQA